MLGAIRPVSGSQSGRLTSHFPIDGIVFRSQVGSKPQADNLVSEPVRGNLVDARRSVPIALFVVGLALVAREFAAEDVVGTPAQSVGRSGTSGTAAKPNLAPGLPQRQPFAELRGDPFAEVPVPQAPVAPVKLGAITQPPLPYRFAGVLHNEDGLQVMLAKGDQLVRISKGDALEGGFRVTAIGEGRIELVYEPLGSGIILEVGPALALEAPKKRAPAGAANLRWEGPERLQLGADFDVALRVSYDRPLRAAPMQLRFEPGVLEPLGVRAGKFFEQGNFSYHVSPAGAIFIGASAGGAAPGTDAELLVVTFKPVKAGATAALRMAALSLQGAGGAVAHGEFADYRAAIGP